MVKGKTALFLAVWIICAACSGQTQKAPGSGAPGNRGAADNAAGDNASASARDSEVVAVINGEGITGKEVAEFCDSLGFQKGTSEEWANAIDTLINNRLLAGKAVSEGVARNPRVSAKIESATNGLWKKPYWDNVLAPTVKVTGKDYEAAAPAFPETLTVRQLVVSDRARAEELRNEALKDPGRFEEIVRANSEGLTAEKGGLVPGVTRDSTRYDKATLDALFAARKGDFTRVLESPIGYTFCRVVDRTTPEQARREWRKKTEKSGELIQKRAERVWAEHKRSLVGKSKVTLHEKRMKAFAEALEKKQDLRGFLGEPIFSVDNTVFYFREIIDPSGTGVVHGMGAIDVLARRRIEDYVIARQMDRIGLKERFPDIVRRERYIRENILARAYVDQRAGKIRIGEREMRRYYDDNPAKYVLPRRLDLSVLETRSPDRLKNIYGELSSGEPFEKVVDRWSDIRTNPQGRIAPVPVETVAKEFAPVKSLAPGEYTKQPIELEGTGKDGKRYVVFRLNRILEKETIPFERANKDDIRKALLARRREEVVMGIMGELRKGARVEITPRYYEFVRDQLKGQTPQGRKG